MADFSFREAERIVKATRKTEFIRRYEVLENVNVVYSDFIAQRDLPIHGEDPVDGGNRYRHFRTIKE